MKNKVCKISLFSAILASVSGLPMDIHAANNALRSYANAYNQVNALRSQQEYLDATAANATTASATANLPVMVADEKLATAILNNTSETKISDLDSCAMIYPNGVFRWEIPESGVHLTPVNQCVAVVTLIDANSNAVLATTTIAAGDSIKCNIDSFPESGMNETAIAKVEFPADKEPTLEDVEATMNEEQKQNAGIKIAAGAIISGVAGNLLAKKEAGDTKMFGTTKTRLIDTAIGAAAGAGIMAASSYGGKVAGDTIKSTAVNAASGMVVGNMLAATAGGNGYLDIQTCTINAPKAEGEVAPSFTGQFDCIAGKISERGTTDIVAAQQEMGQQFFINKSGEVKKCVLNTTSKKCEIHDKKLVSVILKGTRNGDKSFEDIFGTTTKNTELQYLSRYIPDESTGGIILKQDPDSIVDDNTYYEISSAYEADNEQPAYIIFQSPVKQGIKGYKAEDLSTLKANGGFTYFLRNYDGSVGAEMQQEDGKEYDFEPKSRNASDGGLVDLNNKARAKGTIVGTAAGGAMGGIAGYQGAKTEVSERWTAAVIEYKDSLSNFVCMTGTRYLSKYNDYAEIPALKKSE